MPRFKKSVLLLCVIFCLADEKQKSSVEDPAISINAQKREIDSWEKTLAAYDRAILNFIGTKPLAEIQLREGENYVRLRKILPKDNCQFIFEVSHTKNALPEIKCSKVKINPYCNPLLLIPYNEAVCFELVHFHQKIISSIGVDMLMNIINEQKFWGLLPNETSINGLNTIYNEEHWLIEAKSAFHIRSSDSVSVISNSVMRSVIHDFYVVHEIGNQIAGMAEDKFTFP